MQVSELILIRYKFTGDAPNPVSLCLITGTQYKIVDCLKQLASDIDKRYKELISGNHTSLKSEYVSMLYRHHEWCKFRDSNGSYTGRIKTVSDSGLLSIEDQTGKISEYAYKEVEYSFEIFPAPECFHFNNQVFKELSNRF